MVNPLENNHENLVHISSGAVASFGELAIQLLAKVVKIAVRFNCKNHYQQTI